MEKRISRARHLFANWVYPGKWRRRAMFDAQRSVLAPHKRDLVAGVAAALVRARRGRPFTHAASPAAVEGARALGNEGYVELGKLLTKEQCDAIVAWAREKPTRSVYHPELGQFPVADAPQACNVVEYPAEVVLECPQLMALANHPSILSVAEQFLGAKPTISALTLWWSLAGRPKPKEAQLFHRDVDDVKFCKLFVYLTDVDMTTGPHVFVRNSPPLDLCTKLGRFTDEEVTAAFGADAIRYFCGERGESFIVNTFGVHKGLLPQTRNRLIFQVQYSLFPIFLYDYDPTPTPAATFPHDWYVNRLFVRRAAS